MGCRGDVTYKVQPNEPVLRPVAKGFDAHRCYVPLLIILASALFLHLIRIEGRVVCLLYETIAKVRTRPLNPPQGDFRTNQGLKSPPAGMRVKLIFKWIFLIPKHALSMSKWVYVLSAWGFLPHESRTKNNFPVA